MRTLRPPPGYPLTVPALSEAEVSQRTARAETRTPGWKIHLGPHGRLIHAISHSPAAGLQPALAFADHQRALLGVAPGKRLELEILASQSGSAATVAVLRDDLAVYPTIVLSARSLADGSYELTVTGHTWPEVPLSQRTIDEVVAHFVGVRYELVLRKYGTALPTHRRNAPPSEPRWERSCGTVSPENLNPNRGIVEVRNGDQIEVRHAIGVYPNFSGTAPTLDEQRPLDEAGRPSETSFFFIERKIPQLIDAWTGEPLDDALTPVRPEPQRAAAIEAVETTEVAPPARTSVQATPCEFAVTCNPTRGNPESGGSMDCKTECKRAR